MSATQKRNFSHLRMIWSALALICAFFLLTSCESKKTIVYGLEQNDANEILVFLASKGIDGEKVKSTEGGGAGAKVTLWDVVVDSDKANDAMWQLNQQGLPRRSSQSVLGIFSTGGLVSSDLQEKIKYRAALAAQLAGTIRKYEGVLDADVQISFPEEDPLNPGKTKGKITASIWVKHSGILDDPNSHLATKIKRYVASAITGLNYDDVNIVSVRSQVGSRPEGPSVEEEKQYVDIWTLVLAKDSVSRFRWIFFSFITLILLLALALTWLFWKTYPLLAKHGGMKSLLSIKPLIGGPPEEKKTASEDALKEPPKKEDKKKGNIEKGIDET